MQLRKKNQQKYDKISTLQYLAPPLASEGVPGVSSARATSSASSPTASTLSSSRTGSKSWASASSTLKLRIEVRASIEAAVPMYLGIMDFFLSLSTELIVFGEVKEEVGS